MNVSGFEAKEENASQVDTATAEAAPVTEEEKDTGADTSEVVFAIIRF